MSSSKNSSRSFKKGRGMLIEDNLQSRQKEFSSSLDYQPSSPKDTIVVVKSDAGSEIGIARIESDIDLKDLDPYQSSYREKIQIMGRKDRFRQ